MHVSTGSSYLKLHNSESSWWVHFKVSGLMRIGMKNILVNFLCKETNTKMYTVIHNNCQDLKCFGKCLEKWKKCV